MDTPTFYIFLFIHLVSLIVGFGAVIVIDSMGLLWLFGRIKLQFLGKVAGITQALIWIGWSGLVLSGIGLILHKGYIDNLTIIKLFFVVLLGFNGIFLHYLKHALKEFEKTNKITNIFKFRMGLATSISQMGWWGAIFIGFIHRHWQHYIPWPSNPYIYIIGIIALIGIISLSGEIILK